MHKTLFAASIALALSVGGARAEEASTPAPAKDSKKDTPTLEELYTIIQEQQEQIDRLVGRRAGVADGRTTIGGYGELHYNNLDSKNEMDFHRFIIFLNHEFSEDIRFYSELELEHALAGESKPGEIELEQAYVEFDLTENTFARGGLFLVPVGILNETHEPTTFYGVERNPIESNIIPTTWWEGGAAVGGRLGDSGFSYDLALHSGLKIGSNFNIRSGRQKVASAVANDPAATARVKYTGLAGLELAASIQYQHDYTQGLVPDTGAATLVETHAVLNQGPFSARALYARWNLDGAAPEAQNKDVQDGYYVEGAWRFNERFGFFARYNAWDNGGTGDTAKSQTDAGFNFWPHKNVVLKFDVMRQGKSANDKGFNLGIGYQF
ncbi:MAG TPA: porin [Gammaproteobacteria bacterium]|nr:porin [Gammaproteobacteria bacterium]